MSIIQYFSEQPVKSEIPVLFRDPFDNNPHPLAILASRKLQQRLMDNPLLSAPLFDEDSGKMFGVIVVADEAGKVGYLSGFSGMLNKQWIVPGFVPPVFNIQQRQSFLDEGETLVTTLTQQIERQLTSAGRLQQKQKLVELERQQQKALSALKNKHRINKQQRHIKRSALKNDQYKNQHLQHFSFLSQQDKRELKKFKLTCGEILTDARQTLDDSYDDAIYSLKQQRKQISQRLHDKVFDGYLLSNKSAEVKPITHFFDGKVPAGGSGDCAAPKLIQFAHNNNLKILAMAEFWWGRSPPKGIRHHAQFYPPCRGKCHPVIPFMLKGVIAQKTNTIHVEKKLEPQIVYEDECLVVINKPAGMLSIPGKQQQYSVLSWLKQRYPQATGALLVHRLDMATSGLLLAAKNAQAYKQLQKQFINRSVKKRYVAVLSKKIKKQDMTVELPLRVDLDDRPRQLVCFEHGKAAVTYVDVISSDAKSTRVYFYPVTGRTHQLRVHAAHRQGLDAAIVGDELYGMRSDRLLLHAEKLSFRHPLTGETVDVKSEVPF